MLNFSPCIQRHKVYFFDDDGRRRPKWKKQPVPNIYFVTQICITSTTACVLTLEISRTHICPIKNITFHIILGLLLFLFACRLSRTPTFASNLGIGLYNAPSFPFHRSSNLPPRIFQTVIFLIFIRSAIRKMYNNEKSSFPATASRIPLQVSIFYFTFFVEFSSSMMLRCHRRGGFIISYMNCVLLTFLLLLLLISNQHRRRDGEKTTRDEGRKRRKHENKKY